MNKYEAVFIFPEEFKDEMVEEKIGLVTAEIKKLHGAVDNVTRLGKRSFARPIRKRHAGIYAIVNFQLNGAQVSALQARYHLMEDALVRVQIVCAPPPVAPVIAAAPATSVKGN